MPPSEPPPEPHPSSKSPSPVASQVPAQVVVHAERGRFGRILSWLGWAVCAFCIVTMLGMAVSLREYFDTTGGIKEKFHSRSEMARDKIAVINVTGTIFEGDGFVKKQINRVRNDQNIKGIVLRINSPGGTITGSDYLYHHLQKLRDEKDLPLVVSMGALAASGGYYIAMAVGDQEQSIFAEPTTTTGSIGVIIPHYDLTGLMERFDIRNDSIVSHPRKQLLSMTIETDPEDRAILQKYVDTSFHRFKEIVKSGRPKFRDDPARLDQLATGEIFTAEQAKESGLIDEIGFVEEAIDRAIELAQLDEDDVRVITYTRPVTLAGALGIAQSKDQTLAAELANLAVPQAYYLWSSLPILAGSSTN